MEELENQEKIVLNGNKKEVKEEERLLEEMVMLDFGMQCSTLALQTQGKWRKLENSKDV